MSHTSLGTSVATHLLCPCRKGLFLEFYQLQRGTRATSLPAPGFS